MQLSWRIYGAAVSCMALVVVCVGAVGEDTDVERMSTVANPDALTLPADFFPILPWDPQHGWYAPYVDREHGIESIAACGFTVAGFVKAEDLPQCEKLGLRAILLPDVENAAAWSRQWGSLSDDEIDSRVKAVVEEGGDSDAILGYYIMDEPGAALFPALGKAVAAVRKYAPGKLAYINLFPDYATLGAPDRSQLETGSYTEYLERFVDEVRPQFVSYDNYIVQFSNDLKKAEVAVSYYTNLLEVRRVALMHGLPFWNVVASRQIVPDKPIPSPTNLLFQAYTTLAAGGHGVSWYTYYWYPYYGDDYGYEPIGAAGNKTSTWGYLQMVNTQIKTVGPIMNRLRSTGVFFTEPPPAEALPLLPGRLIMEIDCETPIMAGEFVGDDERDAVMVVNLSTEQSAKLTVTFQEDHGSPQVVSTEDGSLSPLDKEKGLWLVAGQGALIILP